MSKRDPYPMFQEYEGEDKEKRLIMLRDRYPTLRVSLWAKRMELEKKADFMFIVEMLRQRMTWLEIAEVMNAIRPYYLTPVMYRKGYLKRISRELTAETARDELESLLDYYSTVILETIEAWRNSKGDKESVQRQGKIDADTGGLTKEYHIISEMKSDGDVKYLEVMLRAVQAKEKLLISLMKDNGSLDSSDLFTDYELADDNGQRMVPINSEKELDEH